MITGFPLVLIFFASIIFLLLLITKFKINPFLALLIISYLTGFAVRMPVEDINQNVANGFGSTLKGIGIVIGLGIILGILLSKSGAAEVIARSILRVTGNKHAPLAIALTGLLVSIPVFMDAAFVILFPLVLSISRITKISKVTLTTALAVGLIISHCTLIPTPGPVEVVNVLKPNYLIYIGMALGVSIVAALAGAWLWGLYIGRKYPYKEVEYEIIQVEHEGDLPVVGVSFIALLMPIILILLGSSISLIFSNDNPVVMMFAFFGDKNIALLTSVLFSLVVFHKYLKSSVNDLMNKAGEGAGMIMLITGAGGSYGFIVKQCGIGDYLIQSMNDLHFPLIVTGFLLAALLRASLGSATVSLITTSTIVGQSLTGSTFSNVLVTVAICLGGVGFSLPNDSGFWVVSRFANLSVRETFASWSAGGTIAALTGFLVLLIINFFT